jgi:hypothetical protein
MHIISMPQLLFTQTPLLVAHTEERNGRVETCHSCMNGKVESLPISDNEIYTLETFMGTQRDGLRS